MKILHFMVSGGTGGIEILNKEYAKYSKLENIYVFFWAGGCIADEMRAAGNRSIELNASKADFFGPLRKMFRLCKKEKPDAVIVHYKAPILYLYALMIKRKYPHIQILAYVHEDVNNCSSKNKGVRSVAKHAIINLFFQRADGMIAISDFVKRSIIKRYHVPEEKIEMIYNGVDINRFQQSIYDSQEQRELIYVGRLTEDKGVQNVIRVLAELPKDLSWRFGIVGDGSYRSMLEKMAKQYQLESKIKFWGNRRDVQQLLSKSEIFIHMPEWEEGFGIAVVEAMAAGLICVCAKSGAIPEIIDHGKSGYLINDIKSKELSERLIWIMRNIDCDAVMQLRISAKNKAKDFAIEVYTKRLDEFLRKQCI